MVLSARFGELDEAPLARSPIVSVVWQLRFEDHPALAAPQAALRFQEALGGPEQFSLIILPKVQLSVQASGLIAENMPKLSDRRRWWRMAAVRSGWFLADKCGIGQPRCGNNPLRHMGE